jgi:alanine racemase
MSHRPTIAEIDLDAVKFNYEQLREKVGKETKMLAVVKADGYGHGAIFISKELQRLGADLLGVAICEEGISLRKAGIRKPIIILNGLFKGQVKETVEYNLTPVIFDSNTAQRLSDEGKRVNKRVKVHVKIDTGMGRVGILPKDIMPFFTKLKRIPNLEVEGVSSHLSAASGDSPQDLAFTSLQLKRFEKCLKEIEMLGFSPLLRHIANSAATIDLPPSFCNIVRPGLMLYGAYPSARFAEKIHLKPVMSLKTEIMQIKRVPAGYSISYGRTFVTQRDSVIATLPVGYADGYSRLLSNTGTVLIGGKKVPVVGTVCMDMTMVDVTKVPNINVGDEAVLIGRQGDKEISADEVADKIGTISYEVFCGVSKRVPRIYIKGKKIIGKKTYV